MMRGHGKSDSLIVPRKPPNKAQATEEVEGRRLAKGNLLEQNILRTQSQVGMHSSLSGYERRAVIRLPCRYNLRQEPYAVVPHVRIWAGGAG